MREAKGKWSEPQEIGTRKVLMRVKRATRSSGARIYRQKKSEEKVEKPIDRHSRPSDLKVRRKIPSRAFELYATARQCGEKDDAITISIFD